MNGIGYGLLVITVLLVCEALDRRARRRNR
jgi:hypothetical protein